MQEWHDLTRSIDPELMRAVATSDLSSFDQWPSIVRDEFKLRLERYAARRGFSVDWWREAATFRGGVARLPLRSGGFVDEYAWFRATVRFRAAAA